MSDKEYLEALQNFKQSLNEWAQDIKNHSEAELAKGMLRGILNTSPLMDQFSTWLLAGTGATTVFLISNIEKIIKFIGTGNFKLTLSFVCLSLIFGVLQKLFALQSTIQRTGEEFGRKLAEEVLEKHGTKEQEIEEMGAPHEVKVNTDIDIVKVFTIVINTYPIKVRPALAKQFKKVLENPMYGYEKGVRTHLIQLGFTALQIASFLGFVVVVIFSV